MSRRLVVLAALALSLGCGGPEGALDAGPGGPSGPTGPTGATGPTAAQAAWLTPHDQVRAGTYPGVTVSPAPSPALPALTWSPSAAAVAQAWADGCVYAHNAGILNGTIHLGENIAASSPGFWDEAGVVGAWASEWSWYDHATNTCAAPVDQSCGHYTQLVWRGTLRVGCGYRRCTVNSPFPRFATWDFFVCDYDPPGNFIGQRPY